MANNFNEILRTKEEEELRSKSEISGDDEITALDDTQRVKVLSPGRLVVKRFLRNKLAIVGSCILIIMFVFTFLCPLLYPYGQTDIFYKYDYLTVDYAQANERSEYSGYSVDDNTEVHFSVKNMMTSYIKQMEAEGLNKYDVAGSDGAAYTIEKLGENVYTLNTATGSETAVFSGMTSVAAYNSKIRSFSGARDMGEEFKTVFADAVTSKATGFRTDGEYYLISSTVKNSYEALQLSTGSMDYKNGNPGSGFLKAFLQEFETGAFEYRDERYTISGDPKKGFIINPTGSMNTVMVFSLYVFDAFDTSVNFSNEFKAQALLALYNDKTFTANGEDYSIAERENGYFILNGDSDYAILSTFAVRRYSGEDSLELGFKAAAAEAITEAEEAGKKIATFTYALPHMDSEGNYISDENGNYTSVDTEITAVYKVDGWVLTCDQITYLIDIYGEPSREHTFGTDADGFDILARMMYGGRVSLMVGFVVVIIECLLGVILGGIAGYFGGWLDSLIMRLVDIFYCIPTYPILIILGAFFDSIKMGSYARLLWMMALMGILGWASVARLVRGQILSLREQEFITAAEAVGLSTNRKIFRHLIPNVMPQLIVSATMGLGSVIIMESTLSFLGLGVKHPLATWGTMINSITSSNENLVRYAYIWIPVGLLICLTVIAFNFVGDGLRDAFDPKMKQ